MKIFNPEVKDKFRPFIYVMYVLLLICFFLNAHAQEKHAVQIRTFDQSLAPYPNLEVSVNNSEYLHINNKGVAFAEFTNRELPVKSILIKDDQLEAASWNYVRGTLEIMVRKKNYKLTSVLIKNDHNEPVSNLRITFKGKTTTTSISDAKGQIQIPLGLSDAISSINQFTVNGYTVKAFFDSPEGKVLTVAPILAKNTEGPPDNLNFALLDTIQSLPAFYKVINNHDLTKLSQTDRQRMDAKFNELFGQIQLHIINELKLQRIALLERISDSTFLTNDIKTLIEQAKLENKMLGSQRGEFDQIVALINKKLDKGIANLSEEGRRQLLDELTLLEDLLIQYESLFFKNQNDYRVLIKDIKNHFSEFEDLEEKLTVSEHIRIEQESLYKQRLLAVSALVIVFALLIILLIYFGIAVRRQKRALQKANGEIKRINENLEVLVSKRTKLLQSANSELDTFLYRASHDLRTPVRSIMGLCQLAEKLKEGEREEILDRIATTSKEMDQLLAKLTIICEINQPPNTFTSVRIIQLIEKIKHSYQQQISDRQIELVVNCQENLIFHSNSYLIESIIFNLLENAFYFSTLQRESFAHVEISAEIKDMALVLVIHDNGIGISEPVKDRLFEMFFRGSEFSIGNGLGLYIVQKAVKLLNGNIKLESVPGEFTEFTITLPPKFKDEKVIIRL
jgi:signal transduction histidine kinase